MNTILQESVSLRFLPFFHDHIHHYRNICQIKLEDWLHKQWHNNQSRSIDGTFYSTNVCEEMRRSQTKSTFDKCFLCLLKVSSSYKSYKFMFSCHSWRNSRVFFIIFFLFTGTERITLRPTGPGCTHLHPAVGRTGTSNPVILKGMTRFWKLDGLSRTKTFPLEIYGKF